MNKKTRLRVYQNEQNRHLRQAFGPNWRSKVKELAGSGSVYVLPAAFHKSSRLRTHMRKGGDGFNYPPSAAPVKQVGIAVILSVKWKAHPVLYNSVAQMAQDVSFVSPESLVGQQLFQHVHSIFLAHPRDVKKLNHEYGHLIGGPVVFLDYSDEESTSWLSNLTLGNGFPEWIYTVMKATWDGQQATITAAS
jgi:hypothetical protein